MIRYDIRGYSLDESGSVIKAVRVRGLIKDSRTLLGDIMRRHPELRSNSDRIHFDRWVA